MTVTTSLYSKWSPAHPPSLLVVALLAALVACFGDAAAASGGGCGGRSRTWTQPLHAKTQSTSPHTHTRRQSQLYKYPQTHPDFIISLQLAVGLWVELKSSWSHELAIHWRLPKFQALGWRLLVSFQLQRGGWSSFSRFVSWVYDDKEVTLGACFLHAFASFRIMFTWSCIKAVSWRQTQEISGSCPKKGPSTLPVE